MTPADWAGLAVSVTTLVGALAMVIKHLTKHYFSELKPNGGNSIKDEVREIKSEMKATKEQVSLLAELVKEVLRK